MARRWESNMNGERFLGDTAKKHVHDLDREHDMCGISDIIQGKRDEPLTSLVRARFLGYEQCEHCLRKAGRSMRRTPYSSSETTPE